MKIKIFIILIIYIPLLSFSAQSDPYMYPVVNAGVNKKVFDPKHELNLHIDYLPSNIFYRLYGAGFGYSLKLKSDFRWEIFNVSFFAKQDSVLNKNMSKSGADTRIDAAKGPDYIFFSSAEYYPLYGKGFFSHHYFSLSRFGFSAGLGQVFFSGFPANAVQVGLKGAMMFSSSHATVLEMNYVRTFPSQKYFESMLFFKIGWMSAF